jgi:glycosyltransferase involved in cell wall biosynthesis
VTDSFRSVEDGIGELAQVHARTAVFVMTNTLETGGSERQFVTIANALDREKFSVSLGCLKKFGSFVTEVDELHEFSPEGSLYGVQSWRARFALSRFLRQKRVEVAQSFDFYSNLMLIPAAWFARVPVVVGSHRQLGDLLTPRQFKAQNAVFRFCDRVVCNSRAAARRLRETGIQGQKLTVIPNGLPDALFASVAPALPRETGVVRIGMISRMNDPVKGHEVFLRVAQKLTTRHPQLRFVLVGDGPLRVGLEERARELGLGQRVMFLGERRDVPAVLASLDISVMPSSSESLSNAILESMAAGVAVVATEIGGTPDLVEHGKTGLLFSSGDEAQFVAALETLVTRPELRERFGTCGRDRVREECALLKVRDRYQDLYCGVLAQKRAGRSGFAPHLEADGTGTRDDSFLDRELRS